LLPQLTDSNLDIRSTAVFALSPSIAVYPELKQPFLEIAGDTSMPVEARQEAMLALSNIGVSEVQSILTSNLNNDDWSMRQSAAIGLSNFIDPQIPQLLWPLTQDVRWEVRQAAAFSLGNFNQPQTIDYLKPLLADDNWQVRLAAVNSFGNFNDPQIVDFITPSINDPVWQIRQSAALGLGNFTSPAIPQLLVPLTQDAQWQVRQAAALSLGNFNQPQAIDYLRPLLNDYSWEVKVAVIDSLSRINDIGVIDSLTYALNDYNWQVRYAAVYELGRIEAPQISNILISSLQDPSPIVRQAAIESLGVRVQEDATLIDPLVNVLENDTDLWSRQLAAFSLRSVQSPQVDAVSLEVWSNIPDTVVLIPGVDDDLGFDPFTKRSSTLDESIWSNWHLRHILEAGGVNIIEHTWNGNLIGEDFRDAQLALDGTINRALSISQAGKIGIISYSGGNYVAERLFDPTLSSNVREALNTNSIHIISLGNPSGKDFSLLDNAWINVWSWSDPISYFSVVPQAGIYNINIPNLSHFTYDDQRAISAVGYYMFGWKYTPYSGNWPGSYNFNSFVSPGYYSQAGNINVTPSLWLAQQFRAPDNYYLQQSQFPMVESTFMTFPSNSSQWYSPVFNSAYDGSRIYQYVPVAPTNYYLQQTYYTQQFYAPNNYYISPSATMP
jgi:HEAT repeat protein